MQALKRAGWQGGKTKIISPPLKGGDLRGGWEYANDPHLTSPLKGEEVLWNLLGHFMRTLDSLAPRILHVFRVSKIRISDLLNGIASRSLPLRRDGVKAGGEMKGRGLLLTVSLSLFVASVVYAEVEPLSHKELNDWMVYYYKNPKPEMTPRAVYSMGQLQDVDDTRLAPLSAFLSFVFRDNPGKVRGWLSQLSPLSACARKVVSYALWYSRVDEAQNLMKSLAESSGGEDALLVRALLEKRPTPFEEVEIASASTLDTLWGAFFATGGEKYVIRIMSALPYVSAKGDMNKLLIGEAARWSLASNAVQHEKVLAICTEQIEKQPEEISTILKLIVARVREEKSRL
jgi:hypothetical protein